MTAKKTPVKPIVTPKRIVTAPELPGWVRIVVFVVVVEGTIFGFLYLLTLMN